MNIRILPAGDKAVLLDLPNLDITLALFQRLNANIPAGVTELVPAAKTILISFDITVINFSQIKSWCLHCYGDFAAGALPKSQAMANTELVEIPVNYNGQDLESVAQHLGLSITELIERHTGSDFIAAFAGFAPGFVYLSQGDPCFTNIPRLDTPRTRVPASSVAVAGDFSAVYPKSSPGGWRLLGTTPVSMWDLNRARPALVQPGFRVRFTDLSKPGVSYSLPATTPVQATTVDDNAGIQVINPGVQTLVQDFGRSGLTAMGVSASGALDRAAMQLANSLVGNPANYAVLENAMGGLQLRFKQPAIIAISGAELSVTLTTDSGVRIPAAANSCLFVETGNVLKLGNTRAGMRAYLAVRGGFAIAPVLGSMATDTLAGIGPKPIHKNSVLPIYNAEQIANNSELFSLDKSLSAPRPAHLSLPAPGQTIKLPIILGPRNDWFTKSAITNLLGQKWQVSAQSNRVGLRLQAAIGLERQQNHELPSEGTVAGAIQVPASGQPVLFLADHPLTGGYPVVAVLHSDYLDIAAQIPIGAFIQFQLQDQGRP